jgi:predicted aspartyl protease
MWLDISASLSIAAYAKGAAEARDSISEQMASEQIALAKEMARTCQQSNYMQCGEPESTQADKLNRPASKDASAVDGKTPTLGASILVPLQRQGSTYVVPVLVNNAITLNFVVDSGAADVSIPVGVVMTLFRAGTVRTEDFIGKKTYTLADGSTIPSTTFRIRSLKIGEKIVESVVGNVAPVNGALLLGQSFLSRFKSWSIDNTRPALVLNE